MSNILIVPDSGSIYFSTGLVGSSAIPNLSSGVAFKFDNSAGVNITSYATGVNDYERFSVDGYNGRLFNVSDNLTGVIFSVNDAAGLPIIEVDSSTVDKVTMGTYGNNSFVINDNKVGIGTSIPAAKLDIVDTTLASGESAGSALNISQTWNTTGTPTAVKINVNGIASGSTSSSRLLDVIYNGNSYLNIIKDGQSRFAGLITVNGLLNNSVTYIRSSPIIFFGAADQTSLRLEDTHVFALRGTVNAQTFRIYNTYTDSQTFERLNLKWDTNVLKIGTEKGSVGGVARDLAFETDGITRMTITSAGNIGIGTINPTSILHLRGGASPILKIEGFAAGSTYLYPAISFHSNNNQGNYESARIEGFGYHPSGFNNLNFYINNSSGVLSRMWQMDSLGNIVQNPGAYSADMPETGIIFTSKATNGTGFRTIKITACVSTGHPGESLKLQAGNANAGATGVLNFGGNIFIYGGTPNISGVAPKYGNVILAHDGTNGIGNVGIGTTTPTGRLEVMRAVSDGGVILRIGDLGNSSANFDFTRSPSTGALSLQGNQPTFNNIIFAPTSGNVGIGTTTPASKLTITGGDIEITDVNSGVIFKTPDGTKRYRMTIDNAGAPVFTLLA